MRNGNYDGDLVVDECNLSSYRTYEEWKLSIMIHLR